MREYWTRALSQIQAIRFTLDHVISDGNRVAIIYISEINGKRMRAAELFLFDQDGLVERGEAMYGIEF